MKGSRTESNLLAAFSAESQARNLYTYFASQAEKDGYHQISRIFLETAEHERIHGKSLFKMLPVGECELKMVCHAVKIESTIENLRFAIEDELANHSKIYPQYAKVAREEGFEDAARLFLNIAVAEKHHEKRFRALLKNIEDGSIWKQKESVTWICAKCGFIMENHEPPSKCPACAHPREYFEVLIDR